VADRFRRMAVNFGLLCTGGSDSHGIFDRNFTMIGSTKIPYSDVIALKKYKNDLDRNNGCFFDIA
jgi:hypothetical protein